MLRKIKRSKFLIAFLFGIIGFIAFSSNANALTTTGTLIRTKIPNIYYERTRTDYYFSYQFSNYAIGDKIAYCIEPAVDITESTYHGTSDLTSGSGYSAETMRKVLLYAYYGYEYEGHNTELYRVATQTLIWEEVNTFKFTYHTERYGYGDYIDISSYKNEILRLVNNHYLRPSFNGQTITAQVGETITLTDTNNVLSNYDVYGDNIANIVINGNKLTFTTTTIGEVNLRFVKKQYTSEVALVYYNSNSQKMVTSGTVDPVYFSVKVNSLGGIVDLQKLDSKTLLAIPRGDGSLQNAVYGIYNMDDVKVGEITTNNNAFGKSSNLPAFGRYYLKEQQTSLGYTLDQTKYYFESTLEDINPSVRVFEKAIERKIELFKVFADGKTTILTYEPNVTFEFYLKSNNELYATATTDANGRLSVILPYGTYTGKQITTTPNYEKVKDFEIVVNNSSTDPITKIISNAEITAKLKLIKIDAETGDIIARAGIKFKIYDVSKEEYVCQTITYPTTTTLCEFETDKNGVLITPYALHSGDYLLEEVDQIIDGYLWNQEKIPFSITDDSDFIIDESYGVLLGLTFENTRIKGSIEIIKHGESISYEDGTYSYEKILLPNVKYELYANEDIILNNKTIYNKGDLISTLITNDEGYAKIDKLYLGSYYLIEVESSLNNIINEEKVIIELTYKNQYTSVVTISKELDNILPKGTLEFTKTDLVSGDVIPNTKIEIYNDEDILVFTGITDDEGKITITDLIADKYYIIETEASEGYQITDEKIYFEILENGDIIKANMTNELVEVPNTSISDSKILNILAFVLIALGIGYIIYDKTKKK